MSNVIDADFSPVDGDAEPATGFDAFEDLVDDLKGLLQEPDSAGSTDNFLAEVRQLGMEIRDAANALTLEDFNGAYETTNVGG